MSLVVGTNTSAQFAQDALRANQNKIATAMQRLSTGLRINSARDDAAGLAISQSMTSQIRGLNQAVRNINDGVNLLQTAEGGLSSITDMLQRMRELAVQSANGTNSDVQRAYLQKEAAALQEQIGKIADTTTWNDKKLLDGSFTGQKIQVGADSGATMDLTIPTTIGSSVQTVTNMVTTATPKILLLGRTSGSLSPNTNAGGVDMFIQQVDTSLAPSFTKQIGTTGEDAGSRILAVADGSFYVNGYSNGNLDGQTNQGGIDGFLSRYSADGTKLWTQLVGSTGDDYVNGLATSSDGSIYVFGTTNGNIDGNTNSGGADVFVSKFQSDGTKLWTKTLGRSVLASSGGIATNTSGEVYISGNFTGSHAGINSSGAQDGFISKLQSDGTISWTRTFGTTGDDPVLSVRVAPDGTVFATGRTGGSLNGQPYLGGAPPSGWPVVGADAFLIKYDSNGNSVWTKSWGTSSYDEGRDIAFDSNGGIYVTGYTAGNIDGNINSGAYDVFVTKFNANGSKIFTKSWGSSAGNDLPTGIKVGTDNRIYVFGAAEGSFGGNAYLGGGSDGFISILDSAGNLVSSSLIGSSSSDSVEDISFQTIYSSSTTTSQVNVPALSVDISTQAGASSAIGVIDSTLDSVNSARSTIGGYINRLNYAADNATNISTNLAASRSTIQDTDYAEESTNLAKSQIVQQAATAMLVQANQQPQSVLALLKNL